MFFPPSQVSAVDSLEGPLLQVEGLSDLRLELHSKKMNLHLVLIDELHRHLYIKSTNRVGQRGKDRARLGWDSLPHPQPQNLQLAPQTCISAMQILQDCACGEQEIQICWRNSGARSRSFRFSWGLAAPRSCFVHSLPFLILSLSYKYNHEAQVREKLLIF